MCVGVRVCMACMRACLYVNMSTYVCIFMCAYLCILTLHDKASVLSHIPLSPPIKRPGYLNYPESCNKRTSRVDPHIV